MIWDDLVSLLSVYLSLVCNLRTQEANGQGARLFFPLPLSSRRYSRERGRDRLRDRSRQLRASPAAALAPERVGSRGIRLLAVYRVAATSLRLGCSPSSWWSWLSGDGGRRSTTLPANNLSSPAVSSPARIFSVAADVLCVDGVSAAKLLLLHSNSGEVLLVDLAVCGLVERRIFCFCCFFFGGLEEVCCFHGMRVPLECAWPEAALKTEASVSSASFPSGPMAA